MSFKKVMRGAVCVVGMVALACGVASAGDIMSWQPRTSAGGGNPGFLPSFLSQAAAVEFGPEATINRDLARKSNTSTRIFSFAGRDENGNDLWVQQGLQVQEQVTFTFPGP